MEWLLFSYKNVFRNKRRSLMGVSIITIGVIAIAIAFGYINASFIGLRETIIKGGTAHLQIAKKEAFIPGNSDLEYRLNSKETTEIKQVLLHTPHVRFSMPRINFEGLVSNGKQTKAGIFQAVNFNYEESLSGVLSPIVAGSIPCPTDKDFLYAVIGINLAKNMQVKVGDNITMLSSTNEGGINAVDLKITGFSQTGVPDVDLRNVEVPLQAANTLLLSNNQFDRIAVVLDDTSYTQEVLSYLQQHLDKKFDIKPWWDLGLFYSKVVQLYTEIFIFFVLIILLVLLVAVINIITMTVVERSPEIGTMMTFGISNFRLRCNFAIEGFVIGLIGVIGGLVISFIMSHIVNALHIIMPPPPGRNIGYPLYIYISIKAYICMLISFPLLAGIIAWFASRSIAKLKIIDALNHS